MADAVFTITSFLAGEWSDLAQGRVDLPAYKTALNVCYNSLPLEVGAWTRRPGTRLVAHTRGGAQARIIPFEFQEAQPYNMEFTDGVIRYASGPSLVMTNDAAAVSGISAANPAVVHTATLHGWATGNTVMFNTLGVHNPLLQNRQFTITVTDTSHFSLKDALTGANIDGSTLGTFVSGNVTRVMETTSPYTAGAWLTLRSVQAEKVAVLLHTAYAPQALTVQTDPAANTPATFTISALQFSDGPYLDPVTDGAQVVPSAVNGLVNLTIQFAAYDSTRAYSKGDFVLSSAVSYISIADNNQGNTPVSSPSKWSVTTTDAAINNGVGFSGTDIGRHVRLYSEPPIWVLGTVYSAGNVIAQVTVGGGYAYYTCLTNHTASATNAPGLSVTTWGVNAAGALWSWGRISGLLNLISGTLSGSANIGDMNLDAGISAAFDGNTSKALAASAGAGGGGGGSSFVAYVGKNYSGASAQKIQSASVWPTTDKGIAFLATGQAGDYLVSVTVNLYAKSTLPASATDGTLLGTVTVPLTAGLLSTVGVANIPSSDTTTAWNYVWTETVVGFQNGSGTASVGINTAQVQFFGPNATGGAGVTVQVVGPALLYVSPVRTWRLGLFNGTNGWPTCGTYHEGRLWLSGAVPNRIDASVPDSLVNGTVNFAPTSQDGTVTAASGISYLFNSPGTNPIFHMTPDHQGIICGTLAGEWLVQATTINSPLTALNMQAHRVTKIGCANIEPRRTEHTIVFVQKYMRKIVEYFADVFSGKFTAPNLSERAKHLTVSSVEEIAYQQELAPVIWARCGDGSLIGGTYRRDTLMTSQGPTFIGWHRHALGSGRVIESMCVGPSSDGTLDTLSMVTNDAATGIRHIEMLGQVPDESTTLANAWFVDGGIVPTMTQNIVLGGISTFQMGGLWPHNGKTVTVWAGGLDLGDYTVTNGVVNVPFGADAGGLFTSSFVSGYVGTMPIVVGFTYNSDGQIVRPATVQEVGARNPEALGTKGRIHFCVPLLSRTQGIYFGTSFTKLNKANFTTSPDGGNALPITSMKSGLHRQQLNDDPGYDGLICWRVTRPYPATLCAISGFTKED